MKWFLKIFINPYSYDIHGNVDTLLQDNQQLSLISSALQGQRFKKIIYDFDLISGNVNLVSYQDGQPDAFYHFYEYDADNRIIAVYSSNYPQKNALININTVANSPLWDNDAKYFYYAHGPLARVEYGDNKVQGEDYAYTLQGWIKGVNSNTLDTLRDIGKDGAIGSINSIFAKDAFGYTLNYHANDYNAISYLRWNNVTDRFEAATIGSDLVGGTSLPPSGGAGGGLFNGNITSMVTTIVPPTLPKSDSVAFSPLPQGTAYRYDQLNRLVEMKAWQNLNSITNTWGSGLTYSGMYYNKFTYDANGSMLTAFANNQAGQTIDNQIYHHQTINSRKFSNRTYAITDSATITSGNDLLNQTAFTNNADSINNFNNYSYTEIGERKSNKQDSITLITWTVYGKIDSVARMSGSSKYNLKFDYDAHNNRIAKKVYSSNNIWLYTEYYIRDGKGELISTYLHQIIDSTSTVSFAQTEKEIYGINELGIDITKTEMISTLPVSNIFTRTLDNKHYTGNNHLGNVLTTFTDRKLPIDANNDRIIDAFWPDVIASNDYMPFGALLTERTFKKGTFPNSFNGKRDDAEINAQDYGMRPYAPMERELGWRVDQIAKNYPGLSPYQFASNTPIQAFDMDGLEAFFVGGTWQAKASLGYNAWGGTDNHPSAKMTEIQQAFGNTISQHLHWSGNNNKFARKVDAHTIAKQVYEAHVKAGNQEPITLVGHSHGGNVMIEVANILYTEYHIKVDNLLTVNTPVIKAHKLIPALEKTINHYQIYNNNDIVQSLGDGNPNVNHQEGKSRIKESYEAGKSEGTGEFSLFSGAGRTFPNATNLTYKHATGLFDNDPGHHMGNWSKNVANWLPTLKEAIAKNKAKKTN